VNKLVCLLSDWPTYTLTCDQLTGFNCEIRVRSFFIFTHFTDFYNIFKDGNCAETFIQITTSFSKCRLALQLHLIGTYSFNSIRFILYRSLSQITNLPQRALQSVDIDIPDL